MMEFEIKDSGERQKFNTGAVRDVTKGKGRFDLLPPEAIKRLAVHFQNGALKYADRNWEKGMPLSKFLDSSMRHLFAYLSGSREEDHIIAAAWNALCFVQTEHWINQGKLPQELDDMNEPDFIETVREIHDDVLSQGWDAKERELAREALRSAEIQQWMVGLPLNAAWNGALWNEGALRHREACLYVLANQDGPWKPVSDKPRSPWQRFLARISR